MARMPTTKMPARMRVPAPKAEIDAIPLARRPVAASRGKDVISVVTRMRETPAKKGR